MKTLIFLVFIFSLSMVCHAQSLKEIKTTNAIETFFFDEKTIFINYWDGIKTTPQKFYISTDTGNTWNYLNNVQYSNKLFFNKDTAVYIYKPTRTFYRTFDCWKTIDSINLSFLLSDPIGLSIGDSTIFFSSYTGGDGSNQKTYRSSDFGNTWDTVAYMAISNIKMVDKNLGFGIKVYPSTSYDFPREFVKTLDGGASWKIIPETYSSFMIHDMEIHRSVIYIGENILMKSEDYGHSWSSASEDLKKDPIFGNAFSFINDSVGFLVCVRRSDQQGQLFRTYNKGDNWHLLTEVPRFYRDISTYHKDNFTYILLYDDIEDGMLYLKYPDSVIYNSQEVVSMNNQFRIFPNPAEDYINIVTGINDNVNLIEIIALNGRIIKQFDYPNCNSAISIKDILPGIYLVRVTTNERVYVDKILKNP